MPATTLPTLRASGRAFAQITQFHPELTAFRRDLHAHPELGFEEVYTSSRVAQALICAAWTRFTRAWVKPVWWRSSRANTPLSMAATSGP